MFGNHLLGVSSKQVVRLEKGAEVAAGGEPVPRAWVESCCPVAEVFSDADERVFQAFRSLGEDGENVGGTAG